MALGLLWLCLILPWALKTQAQNSKVRSRPSLRRAPLQPNFQADQNVTGYKGLQKFKMKVVETDYQQYAVVFYRALVNNKVYIECLLYGRNRNINPDLLSHFTHLARSMGFRPRYINFTILKTGCNIDYVEEPEILGPFT